MKNSRIYHPTLLEINQEVDLTPTACQHVAVVLRKKLGDYLTLFCGNNREFTARIVFCDKKKVRVKIELEESINRESPCSIHLVQGVSKGDRMEIVVQKAVELGVVSITPLITERCVVRLDKDRMEKKRQQWQAIAMAACEQCGRNIIPEIRSFVTLSEFFLNNNEAINIVLSPLNSQNWRALSFSKQSEFNLIIGPEGGFSSEETELLLKMNSHFLSLGKRILRTETAAIAGLALLQGVFGDL